MKHVSKSALLASAAILDMKGDDDDPIALVTKAVGDLQTAVETRLTAVEGKADTTKLVERIAALETKSNRPADTEKKDEPSVERKAFASYLRLGNNTPVDELKTLVVSSDPQGGYLAPKEMSTEFIRDLVLVSPLRAYASVRQTGSPSVSYPKRTGLPNGKWKGETQAQEGSEPTFGQAEIVVKEINTYVDLSNQLLADSGGTAEAEVRLALSDDFGQKEGAAFINGDGALAPEGLLTNADIAYYANGSTTVLSPDALIKLMYAMPAQYRGAGAWAMNGTTLGLVRALKDGQGNYLWQPSFQVGQPESILGRPVVEMPDMPDVAAQGFPIIFGDMSGYRIVDRLDLSVLVNPYLLATNGITRIHATRRVGAGVLQAAKFKKLKMSVS